MKTFRIHSIIITISFLFSACSTIFNTTTQSVELATAPSNAKITINGKSFGTTPQVVNIDRGKDHNVKFEKDGYVLYEIRITRKMSKWFWLNALNGFLPGMIIDWLSGSMYYLLPERIEAPLTEKKVEVKEDDWWL